MTTLSSLPSARQLDRPPDLQVNGMTKQFGRLMALDNLSMHLKSGSFHALLGENGAGKSTLVKCIMGFYQPTAGELLLDGNPVQIGNPRDAHRYGIGMVYQHFTSVPAMTVAENLVLSRFGGAGIINWKAEIEALRAFMSTSPFQVPLETPIAQLAAGQKQKLEILKQIYLHSRILILDEPTSVLTPAEADEVLGLLRQQVSAGELSILMISHKFREVMAFADEITVLRKGKFAGSGAVSELTVADMAEMMMGEQKVPTPVQKTSLPNATPVLEARQLGANKDNGIAAFSGIDLTVHSGEIVGIAGISGNGQRELVEVLAGQREAAAGEVWVNGERYTATRAEMYRHQVCALPEEPLRNACVAHMSVAENMALRTFDRPPQAKGILLLLQAIRQMAVGLIGQFSVKTPSPETPVQNLSGGNVQRAVLARELSTEQIKLLIAANPCFGLDFAAVDFIHTQIINARNRGVAVLLVSEDLDELLKLSDRLIVISDGQFTYQSQTTTAEYAAIGHAMAGH
ncbi:MAG: ABC transporter ATP-binding protein [Pegethrix bostrychoides GSE-TBD4-15B]|jgi:simple sugar transport system ATP-binding protein|uniref:ABC transporter ATP-binding protein n=1 Tax=Pegethrix bostrychoides GSE-TBD4-15B TaxID=2839662 RepID=A0A951U3D4_9CYAN|nr:ABC transporter ATP-binding protein [Pegethrix bostrychoides GSE-TBD4-15B]